MNITFPHMGNTWVTLKGLLDYLGLPVIVPPPTTSRTLSLGAQYAPESACLPLKINIGNLIEAKELGADTFIMAGGVGPCRFGLYAQLEKEILEEIGYRYETLILEPPEGGLWQLLKRVKAVVGSASWWQVYRAIRFACRKAGFVDSLEKTVQDIRPREKQKGTADRIFAYALQTIAQAKNDEELEVAHGLARQKLLHIPQDSSAPVLRIGLVGEIYTLLEPFASLDIEKKLGYLGAHVTRSIYLSDWIREHLLPAFLAPRKKQADYKSFASPYLNHFVGGHARESIGAGVAMAKEGYDGIVQVAPLTCMPEIVAHTIFPRVSEELSIPVLTVYVDEQTGQEGINTRLEAFIDLLWEKRPALDRHTTIC